LPSAKGITYARRYGLQSLCNVGAEDDDGNKASTQPPAKTEKPKPAFTIEKFQAAHDKGFDIAKIKETHYVAADIEAKYLLFSKAAK